MRKFPVHTTLFVTMLACMPLAFAAPPQQTAPSGSSAVENGQREHQPRQPEALFDQLGLTDAQRASVRQLIQQSFQQARPEMEALRQKRMAFDNATPGSNQFKAAADDLAETESSAVRAQVLRQADLRTKVYNLLTPEQRTKLTALVSQREQRMQQRSTITPAASH